MFLVKLEIVILITNIEEWNIKNAELKEQHGKAVTHGS